MKLLPVTLVAILTAASFLGSAGTVSVFWGGVPEGAVALKDPSRSGVVNISLPAECHIRKATMSVSAMAPDPSGGDSPESVRVFLNDTLIWEFNGKDYGAFGEQQRFANGVQKWKSSFGASGGTNSTKVRIPKNADVQGATLESNCSGPVVLGKYLDFLGAAAYDEFGISASDAGDVNKDGYGDIIVGAQYNDAGGSDAGRAYIFYGGKSMDATADVTLTAAAAQDYFGVSVSGAGDVNNDGYDDVIVGAYRNDAGGTDAGRAYIFYGGASMDNKADVILTGSNVRDHFGCSVSGAGDVNKDGFADVIVGADSYASGTNMGQANIYYGGASMDSTADVNLYGENRDSQFGYSVSGAGDVNGDGYDDVAVGAPQFDYQHHGRAYIFFGGANMDFLPDVVDTGTFAIQMFGASVSGAGDVNNDGYDDVIVGGYYTDANDNYRGRANIYYGGKTVDGTADVVLTGALNDNLGYTVSDAGDVDNDGYDDVIVGAESGRAFLFNGGASMDSTADGTFATGAFVSGAGDIDNDGYDDVVIGEPYNNTGGTSTGAAHLFKSFTGLTGVNVSIGAVPVWRTPGYSSGVILSEDFGPQLDQLVRNTPPSGTDKYGNGYVDLSVQVSATNTGSISLGNLSIEYTLDAAVPDFTDALNAYLAAHKAEKDAGGNLTVPVRISSGTAGSLKLTGLQITVDEAPRLARPIPDFELPEDCTDSDLVDLYIYFDDDYDMQKQQNFSLASVTNDSIVKVEILENRYISANALDGARNDNWTGELELVVQASDTWGSARLSNPFRIMVTDVNDAPLITSRPPAAGTGGQEYVYQVVAVDAENDTLAYQLAKKPQNMTIDAKTGLIRWQPLKGGASEVLVVVSDGSLSGSQGFTLTIPNRPPRVTDQTVPGALTDQPFKYAIPAVDDDGDALTFSLVSTIDQMTLDPTTGEVSWTPKQVGDTAVSVEISDGKDKTTYQFTIKVAQGNHLPQFSSSPVTSAFVGVPYVYDANASDADNDPLSFQSVSVPAGMTVEVGTGKLAWTPTAAGNFMVKISVQDGKGGRVVQEFTVLVKSRVKAKLEVTAPLENQKLKGKAAITGKVTKGTLEVSKLQIKIDTGEWSDIPANSTWTYTLDTAKLSNGKHTLALRAYDGKDYSEVVNRTVTIDNPNDPGKGFIPGFGNGMLVALLVPTAIWWFRLKRGR